MSDKETAPWMIEAAKKINRSLFPGQWPTTVVQKIAEIIAAECTAPAPQPADLLQTIRYLLLSWSVFYAKLPDGEYDGLGEMRTALANIKDVEVILAATPQVTPTTKEFLDKVWQVEGTSDAKKRQKRISMMGICCNGGAGGEKHSATCRFNTTTPEKCPTCGSPYRGHLNPGCWPTANAWHSSVSRGTSEQASPTPDKCPTCGSKDYWTALPACHGGIPDSWHSSAPKGTK